MAAKVLAPETRTVTSAIEMRMEGDAPVLVGYAATFNQPYDMGAFRETIDSSAFNRTLGTRPDVRLLIDHDGAPLARTDRIDADGNFVQGTMKLSVDALGLRVEATLDPRNTRVMDLKSAMSRRDLDQMSFAFRVPSGGDSWSDDYGLRTLRSIELNGGDVSVVTYPANPATSVSLRNRDARDAACLFVETMAREMRVGKTLSADTISKLQSILTSLSDADEAVDAADTAIDAATNTVADMLGVTVVDEPETDATPARSGRPLGLVLALAKRLDIPA